MFQKPSAYCRLESFCCHHISDNESLIEEQSHFLYNEKVYVNNFDNLLDLKKRVVKLKELWERRYFSLKKNRVINNIDVYPGFMIYNCSKEWKIISFCNLGWYVLGSNFNYYINQYIINLHGIDKHLEVINKIPSRKISFLIPDVKEELEMNLFSEKLMNIELESFLDGKEITEEIKQEVYYPEMVRRGYIDIIGKKE